MSVFLFRTSNVITIPQNQIYPSIKKGVIYFFLVPNIILMLRKEYSINAGIPIVPLLPLTCEMCLFMQLVQLGPPPVN